VLGIGASLSVKGFVDENGGYKGRIEVATMKAR
jgi:hypothetical protein